MNTRRPSGSPAATFTSATPESTPSPTRSPDRIAARLAGLLFLTAFVTYGAGSALATSVVDVPDALAGVAAAPGRLTLGAVLMLANSAVVTGIGVLLFPVLRQHDERIALGYLATRVVEAVLLAVGVVALLSLVPISDGHVTADAATGQVLGGLAVAVNDVSYQVGMAVLAAGSLLFCRLLQRTRLVPAPLAVWGLIGYAALLAGAGLELSGVGVGLLLAVPGGLFEVTLGVWLVARGLATDAEGRSDVEHR